MWMLLRLRRAVVLGYARDDVDSVVVTAAVAVAADDDDSVAVADSVKQATGRKTVLLAPQAIGLKQGV